MKPHSSSQPVLLLTDQGDLFSTAWVAILSEIETPKTFLQDVPEPFFLFARISPLNTNTNTNETVCFSDYK